MSAGRRSRELFARAERVLPGGVSSPVRAYRAVGGTPLVAAQGAGAELVDADGRLFVDFVGSWGPLILGHADPAVVAAVGRALRGGTSFGMPCEAEIELAEEIVASYPGLEQVRFTSSGTEAVLGALRLARGVTGRDAIVKFTGCYHGHGDAMLVAAGSGLATFGLPASAGVPAAVAAQTFVLPLDDEQRAEDLLRRHGDRIAAVILEPVPANHGLLLQRAEFLRTLRVLTQRAGALLLFDEVITGFRLGRGGAAERYDVQPDLVTFGKVVGGGLPVGAFGGRRELTRQLAPDGPVYHAGTLSGNPLAMAAGLATLRALRERDGWYRLEQLGARLDDLLRPVLARSPVPIQLVRIGSIFWLAWQAAPAPRAAEQVDRKSSEGYARCFHRLAERGILLAPSAYEVGFLSLAHDEAQLARFAGALAAALDESAPEPD